MYSKNKCTKKPSDNNNILLFFILKKFNICSIINPFINVTILTNIASIIIFILIYNILKKN